MVSFDSKKASVEIISALLKTAEKIVPFEHAGIYTVDEERGKLLSLAENREKWFDKCIESYFEEGVIDWIIEEKRAVVISDPEFIPAGDPKNDERNFVLIPFIIDGSGKGLFAIYTSKSKRDFTGLDLKTLTHLSESLPVKISRNLFIQPFENYSNVSSAVEL